MQEKNKPAHLASLLLIILCSSLQSCKSHQNDPGKAATQQKMQTSSLQKTNSIKLYSVRSIFSIYMPDTSLAFANPKEEVSYLSKKQHAFALFNDSLHKVAVNKDSVAVEIKQGEIQFDDLREFSDFKFYKTQKKDWINMGQLGFFSPHSRIVSMKDRKEFYNSFPEQIKMSEAGRKTWATLQEYSFEHNSISSVVEFSPKIQLRTVNQKQSNFNEIIRSSAKYTILIFGASWCRPCKLEDKQLKRWMPAIDTSIVKIIGISIDTDVEKWKKYLQADNLPWSRYLITGGWNNEIFKLLKIQSIPRNLLLDETGKILAENTDIRKVLKSIPGLPVED